MRPSLASWLGLSLVGMAVAQPSDAPDVENFLRRFAARAIMLGDYLYIDGGEITQLVDGELYNTYDITMNSTLSIDMSKSWSSDTVEIRSIPKEAPKVYGQAMWPDSEGQSFYIWGGHSNHGRETNMLTTQQIWRFVADGKGGGAWTKEIPDNLGAYNGFQLTELGAWTTAHNTGFWLGGSASGWTQNFRASNQNVPGMVSFNMTTKTFRNDTTPDVSEQGTILGGQAQYVPRFGPHGLIAVFGGTAQPVLEGGPTSYRDFRNLTFFDPVTKDWYWQMTTGTTPTPRENSCVFGAESVGGTYEIFVFGGQDTIAKSTAEDLYVLTLPGFVWTKLDNPQGGARTDHVCVVAGKRQMVTVGGIKRLGGGDSFRLADPFPQGLGVFDMTELSWGTDFKADAAEYESPKVVQDWYDKNGDLASVEWSSEAVKVLFTSEKSNSDSDTTGENAKDKDSESKKGSSNIGPIVGGVVGGVVAVAACVGAAMLLRRRKRRGQSQGGQFQAVPMDPETPRSDGTTLVNNTPKPLEYGAQQPEMDSYGRVYEMAGEAKSPHPVELDATGINGSGGLASKEQTQVYR